MQRTKQFYFILGLVAVVVSVILPFYSGGYWTRVVTFVSMYIILASAWNMLGGYMGYPSFGHAAFFGIGAYTTGVLMSIYHVSFPIALGGGVILSSIVAVVISPVLRLKGHYFAIATLAVAEAAREFIANMTITGGGTGLVFPIRPGGVESTYYYFYYMMLGAAFLTLLISYWMRRSRVGFALLAIKGSEDTAQSLGININRYKQAPLLLSACFAAVAGGIYGYWITFIDPSSSFHVNISVTMIVMVLLGGAGTVLGPAIGAIFFQILSEFIWSQFLEIHEAVLGIVMILFILFMPQGIIFVLKGRLTWSALKKELERYSI
jgi:branched-chain amino acid transport system permease protein